MRGMSEITVFPFHHIVLRISISEAVDEDLVHERALQPVRDMKVGDQAKGIAGIPVLRDAEAIIEEALLPLLDEKDIAALLLPHHDLGLIVVKIVIAHMGLHGDLRSFLRKGKVYSVHILPPHPETKPHAVSGLRFIGRTIEIDPCGVKRFPVDRTVIHGLSSHEFSESWNSTTPIYGRFR